MFDKLSLPNKGLFLWTIPVIKRFSQGNLDEIEESANSRGEDPIHNEAIIFKLKRSSLLKSIIWGYWLRIVWFIFFSFFNIGLRVSTVYFMFDLLTFVTDVGEGIKEMDEEGKRLLKIDCALITVSSILQGYFDSWLMILAYRTDFKARAGLLSAFFKKLLNISTPHMELPGKIATLVQVDIENSSKLISMICILTSNFINVLLLCILTIYSFKLGSIIFFGMAILIFLETGGIGALQSIFNSSYINKKDKRTQMLKSILQSISYIKIKALESFYEGKMKLLRSLEISELKKYYVAISLLSTSTNTLYMYTFQVVLLGTVILEPGIAQSKLISFTMIYYVFTTSITNIMNYATQLFDVFASVSRLSEFFETKETERPLQGKSKGSINFPAGLYSWKEEPNSSKVLQTDISVADILLKSSPIISTSTDNFILEVVNELQIASGEFICILGGNGSGKSTLLSAILGETICLRRSDNPHTIGGRVSYLPQSPWIFTGTLKDNIIFGDKLEEDKLTASLQDSLLLEDVLLMEHKLGTYCEENGQNLSGGQKARLALARCFYHEADILVLDDPLKALDANVKREIMRNLSSEKFAKITRIFTTNDPVEARFAERIIILEHGKIIFDGDFKKAAQEHSEFFKHIIPDEKNVIKEDILSFEVKSAELYNNVELEPEEIPQTGRISLRNIWHLIKQYGIISIIFWFIIPFVATMSFGLYAYNGTIAWIYAYDQKKTNNYSSMGVNFFYSTCAGISTAVCMLGLLFIHIGYARILHSEMISGVLHSHVTKYLEQVPSGLLLNRFTNDLDTMERQLTTSIISMIAPLYVAFVELYFYFMIANNYIFYGIVFAYVVSLIYLQNRFLQASNNIIRKMNISKTPIIQLSTGISTGISQVRIMQKGEYFRRLSCQYINENVKYYLIRQGLEQGFNTFLTLISALILMIPAFVYIYIKVTEAKEGLDYALLTLFLQQLTDIPYELFLTLTFYNKVESSFINLERCREIASLEPEVGYMLNDFKGEESQVLTPKTEVEVRKGPSISFKNVVATYPHRELPVLNNINFDVRPGEKIAIVGRTGCGKSSLIKTVWKALELQSGDILIDGKSIQNMMLQELRSKLSVISQGIMIIDGSIRENIDPLNEIYNDEIIIQALIKAGMPDRIIEEYSLDFEFEGSNQLSPGFLQLICLTRELVSKHGLLIFDEPTSNFDSNLERRFKQVLFKEFEGATILMISHRHYSTIDCDKVLVMDQGQVVEFGDPKVLINDVDSFFNQLVVNSK